jgi:hypothetical protein
VKGSDAFRHLAWELLFLPIEKVAVGPVLWREFGAIQAEVHGFAADFSDFGEIIARNIAILALRPSYEGKRLFGRFAGVPAIICGAGPSLLPARGAIAALLTQALVIAGGAGLQKLLEGSIEPHFAMHVDPCPVHRFSPHKVPTFFQLRTSVSTLSTCRGPLLRIPGPGNFPLEEEGPWFDGGPTVGTSSVALAYALGCDPIVLVGLDFEGEKKEVRPDWYLAEQWLNHFITSHPDRQWKVIQEGRAALPGVERVALRDLKFPELSVDIGLASLIPTMPPEAALLRDVETSLRSVQQKIEEILALCERKFPGIALDDPELTQLEEQLQGELAMRRLLLPLWEIWKWVIGRSSSEGATGLYLHQKLFFQEVCSVYRTILAP